MKAYGTDVRWHAIMETIRGLRTNPEDDVLLKDIARVLGWDYALVQDLAADMHENWLIDTDMGLGELPTTVEGR